MADEGGIFHTDARCTIDGKPFIVAQYMDSDGQIVSEGQLSPAACLAMGVRCIQSAIEAERDAGLVAFLKSRGLEDNAIAAMLVGMREHRQQWAPDEAHPMSAYDMAKEARGE